MSRPDFIVYDGSPRTLPEPGRYVWNWMQDGELLAYGMPLQVDAVNPWILRQMQAPLGEFPYVPLLPGEVWAYAPDKECRYEGT